MNENNIVSIHYDYLDPYIIYAINKKDFSLWHAYQFFRNLKRPGKYYFCFFHTLEFFAFIILLSFFSKLAFLIFLGVTLHLLIDLIAMLKAKCKKKIIFFSAIARLKARKNKK